MKRLLCLLLIFAFPFSLCGCDLFSLENLVENYAQSSQEAVMEDAPPKDETVTQQEAKEEESPPPVRPHEITVTQDQIHAISGEFLHLVNAERRANGLPPLVRSEVLDTFARSRAEELLIQFSHTRPDGTDWNTIILWDFYRYATLGENIVMTSHVGDGVYDPNRDFWTGSQEQISAAAGWIFKLFKESPEHYANMLGETFVDSGIGIAYVMDETESIPIFYLAHILGSTEQ